MFSNILIQIYVFLSDWKNDPWYESHVELKVIVKLFFIFFTKQNLITANLSPIQEEEESIGKTENMLQPQWGQSFDLEIDNEKQVSVFYNNEGGKQKEMEIF